MVREEGGYKEGVDRKAGSARHEGVHQDRQNAVAVVLQRAGGQNGRNVAAKADQHGDEGLAGQPDGAQEAVHDEGRTGHVAGVLKEGQAEEDQEDGGNEGGDGLDTAADAIGEQGDDPLGHMAERQEGTEAVDKDGAAEHIEEVDKGSTEVDRDHEDQIHDAEKEGDPEDTVDQNMVDHGREGRAQLAVAVHDIPGEPVNKAIAPVGKHDIQIFAGMGFYPIHFAVEEGLEICTGGQRRGDGVLFQQLDGQPTRIGVVRAILVADSLTNYLDGRLQLGIVANTRLGDVAARRHGGNGIT